MCLKLQGKTYKFQNLNKPNEQKWKLDVVEAGRVWLKRTAGIKILKKVLNRLIFIIKDTKLVKDVGKSKL